MEKEKAKLALEGFQALFNIFGVMWTLLLITIPVSYVLGFTAAALRSLIVFVVLTVIVIILNKIILRIKKQYSFEDKPAVPVSEKPKSKFDQYMERSLQEAEKAKHRQGMN